MLNCDPLVTIGLPVYNAGLYLSDAIRSVFLQTYDNWELVIVDDGSTDISFDLICGISDPRVRIVRFEVNKGLIFVLNYITSIANGKYIARMDADDMMHPDRIKRQVEFLERSPEFDMVDTGAIIIDLNANPVGLYRSVLHPKTVVEGFVRGGFFHASLLVRREWMLKNPYDPKYLRCEDRELWARTFSFSRIGHLPGFFYYYRFAGNARFQSYLQSYQSEFMVLRKYAFSHIGHYRAFCLMIRSVLKIFALVLFFILGIQDRFVGRSYFFSPDNKVYYDYYVVLKYVRSLHVDGLLF